MTATCTNSSRPVPCIRTHKTPRTERPETLEVRQQIRAGRRLQLQKARNPTARMLKSRIPVGKIRTSSTLNVPNCREVLLLTCIVDGPGLVSLCSSASPFEAQTPNLKPAHACGSRCNRLQADRLSGSLRQVMPPYCP